MEYLKASSTILSKKVIAISNGVQNQKLHVTRGENKCLVRRIYLVDRCSRNKHFY